MKNKMLVLLILLGLFFGLLFVTATLHESVHILVAFAFGIPVMGFDWFDPEYMAPAITFGHTENQLVITVAHYSGGLVTGALWLSIYLILILGKHAERSLSWWFFGLIVVMLAFWQIGQGLLEGLLHQIYISGAGQFGGVSFIIQGLFVLLGFLIYLRQTHSWREVRNSGPEAKD